MVALMADSIGFHGWCMVGGNGDEPVVSVIMAQGGWVIWFEGGVDDGCGGLKLRMGVVCENEEGRGMAVKSQDENDDVDVYKSYRSSVGAVLEMIEMLLVECIFHSLLSLSGVEEVLDYLNLVMEGLDFIAAGPLSKLLNVSVLWCQALCFSFNLSS
ncbi:hypothetical protein VIGAN_05252500 [Vigna angularis var. angularis]|uniref:Uncharacterized protein n=1 Tax=Vigna angularis var. angularis TaxID=157739 RepID=A0A0S3S7S2_PHAAN|nr:hypothetical protein VIGAN_05252500 [Vigna angularis var. angularis]